ncbi:hypothetical protein K431DRAFT_219097 [Polychaeton citri CBS 116435]|uniref:HTH La-type RNA-binding domain-containing protein n=1 Tax=Polychaeton citri CBS 116435 TaxID=1314669 RepID=A0A9P4QFB0_9PEZI|nr:hypothetical protein K431DRAFT_219097 [Polychaeton citri CBS 116435]
MNPKEDHDEPHITTHRLADATVAGQLDDQFDDDTKAAVIRQVDHYFSDENLPDDEHLLAKTGDNGNGKVSIKHIMGFPKMKAFKGKIKVRNALRGSLLVELVDEQFIRRKHPLTVPLRVKPKLHHKVSPYQPPPDKPWLTKGMMKPTGFEDAIERPTAPEKQNANDGLYSSDKSFITRIETAITLFCSGRKMHQTVRSLFKKWMVFGGFDVGQRTFVGKIPQHEMEELESDRQAKAYRLQEHFVTPAVEQGLSYQGGQEPTWYVDFVEAAKAFLSTTYMEQFDWEAQQEVHTHMNVFRSFYNYLITQNVCPEYQDQVLQARNFCDTTEAEFAALANLKKKFPGDISWACSTLTQPKDAGTSDWNAWQHADESRDRAESHAVISAAVAAFATELKLQDLVTLQEGSGIPATDVQFKGLVGLEVVETIWPDQKCRKAYGSFQAVADMAFSFLKPLGRIICARWDVPHASPKDLPAGALENTPGMFEFYMDVDVLQHCYVGLKMEAEVTVLKSGTAWVNNVVLYWPSFYVVLHNERIRAWKEPCPPRERNQKLTNTQRNEAEDGSRARDGLGIDWVDCPTATDISQKGKAIKQSGGES